MLGATWHGPLVDDIEILYELPALRRLCAVVREVQPTILLLPSPQDYMEDHANTCRLGVSAAFCRGMPNFITDPPSAAVAGDMAVYHALPYGLRDQLRRPIEPDFRVDISSVLEVKRRALGCHRSQRRWLDDSQGIDSYLKAMEDMSAEVGSAAGLHYAEGWRRHSHLGFGPEDFDPLREALAALAR